MTAVPIFCSFSFGRGGRTMMGVSPAQVVETLAPMGVAGLGANCGEGIEPVMDALVEMRAALSSVTGGSSPVLRSIVLHHGAR